MFNGDGEANGEVYLSCVQGVSGMLREPMRWKVKESLITEVDGGGEIGEECKRLFKEVSESNRLIEIMFGYHPKASAEYGIADPMHWELISKMPWAGLETPRKYPKFRHRNGSVFNARLYIDHRLVVDRHGMLDRALLHHPEVLEAAAEFGDPYKVLAPVLHEAHGFGTIW